MSGSEQLLTRAEKMVLTDANIRNNYLRVRQFNGLIPDESERCGAEVLLEIEGVGQVKTTIDKKKGILAERHAIGRFFQVHNLKPGDEITVERIGNKGIKMTARWQGQIANPTTSDPNDKAFKTQDISKEHLPLFGSEKSPKPTKRIFSTQGLVRANDLDGKKWTSYSVSVWKDIRKSDTEKSIDHPAMFPIMLVERVIRCFTTSSETIILDPFMGSGSTLIGAFLLGRRGIGFEIYPSYIELAEQRLNLYAGNKAATGSYVIYPHDARQVRKFIEPCTVDLCFTSPPYWNILTQRRTADYKEIRNYGDSEIDLGRIESYPDFLDALGEIFRQVYEVLKPGKYCVVNVMDLRKGSRFYPFHADLVKQLETVGYIFDDVIIWDRSHEYNNLRPLGYPTVFRINKVHEYLLIFQKPKS